MESDIAYAEVELNQEALLRILQIRKSGFEIRRGIRILTDVQLERAMKLQEQIVNSVDSFRLYQQDLLIYLASEFDSRCIGKDTASNNAKPKKENS